MFRAVERSLMQVQTLVDSLNAKSPSAHRARFLSCSRLPPFWQLETELCRLYQSLGSHRAALDIALRLRQWEVVIQCYHLLQVQIGLDLHDSPQDLIYSYFLSPFD